MSIIMYNIIVMYFALCPVTDRADVELSIEDFNTIGDRVPLLANLKPHGKVKNAYYIAKLLCM